MKNLKATIFVLFILTGFVYSGSNGGYAGAFQRIGLGARSMALGNTGLADEASGYSFFYNPATTAYVNGKIFSLSYSFMSLDRLFNFIGYSMKVPPGAGFSIGWINSGVGDIPEINSLGEITGEIEHSLNGAYFNFARAFSKKISAGLTIKYLWENLGMGADRYKSAGWGWDFGTLYRFNKNLTFAASVRDVASKLKASTDKLFEFGGTTIDKFPVLYLVGAKYTTPFKWLHVLYDFETSNKNHMKHHLGLEAVYKDLLALRFGLNNGNFTAGAGMAFKLWRYKSRLDYAFVPSIVDEGSSHVFSWQIYFN